MKLVFDRFLGRMKLREARGMPPEYGQACENAWLGRGDLRPLERPSLIVALAKLGVKTIYRFGQAVNSSTQFWFHWTTDVDVVKGQIANDTSERTYWTGDGVPKYTTAALGTTGGNLPSASRPLALPAPTLAPVLTPVDGTGTGSAAKRQYVYTFVNEFGDESGPSPLEETTIQVGQHVTLSSLQVVPSNSVPITNRRIYRADAGRYLFVAEINGTDSTFLDDLAADQLGTEIDSTTYTPPPDTLQGLVNMPNGMAAGFDGYDVRFCVPNRYYAWPEEDYIYTMDYPVVALIPLDQSLAVLTLGVPYVLTGIDPAGMSQERTQFLQPCVSKRGAVSTGGEVIYPSPDGLCLIGPGKAVVTTSGLFEPADWEALNPASMIGAWHDNWYIGVYETEVGRRGFMFQPTIQAWVDLPDFQATAFFRDTVTDALYCAIGDQVWKFRGGSTSYNMRYRTKITVTDLTDLPVVRVLSHVYPAQVKVYSEGLLRDTVTVPSSEPVRISDSQDQGICGEWELETTTAARVLVLASSMDEARGVS